MKFCIMISVGSWGGFYFYHDFSWRLCLGWIAITFLPIDGDEILDVAGRNLANEAERI